MLPGSDGPPRRPDMILVNGDPMQGINSIANPGGNFVVIITAKGTETKGIALTSKEVQVFLEAAKIVCPEYYPLFLVAVRAGLRHGEWVALQWGDVQLGKDEEDANRFSVVQHNYVLGEHTTTKSKKSRRVDMSREVRRELAAMRDQRLLAVYLDGRAIFRMSWCSAGLRAVSSTRTISTIATSCRC
jgi:integrase